MKIRVVPIGLSIAILCGGLAGCSSTPRETRKPSVAILVGAGSSGRPSATEVADIHKMMQPEIEKRGYVMAKSSRSADYFVHVRYPVDPLSISGITIVRAEPTVPFLNSAESEEERAHREKKRALADLIQEPK